MFDRWYAAGQIFTRDLAEIHCIFLSHTNHYYLLKSSCLLAIDRENLWGCRMTVTDSSKAKNRCTIRCTIYRKCRAIILHFRRRKCRIAWPWSFCHVSLFLFSRSARGFSTVIFDPLALNVDVETEGSHLALGCSFNSFSHCSWSM